jgi:hypothetical protein
MPESMQNDDQDKRETPFGPFYRPRSIALQMMTLLGAVLGILLIGWLISQALGGVSKNAQILLFIPFLLVLVLGYGLWLSRLEALAFEIIGKGILRALYDLIVKRKKPGNLKSISKGETRRDGCSCPTGSIIILHCSHPCGHRRGFGRSLHRVANRCVVENLCHLRGLPALGAVFNKPWKTGLLASARGRLGFDAKGEESICVEGCAKNTLIIK